MAESYARTEKGDPFPRQLPSSFPAGWVGGRVGTVGSGRGKEAVDAANTTTTTPEGTPPEDSTTTRAPPE
jgi:hypothetical protein